MVSTPGEAGVHQRCGHENKNDEVGRSTGSVLNIGVNPASAGNDAPEVFTLDQLVDSHDPQKTKIGSENWSDE